MQNVYSKNPTIETITTSKLRAYLEHLYCHHCLKCSWMSFRRVADVSWNDRWTRNSLGFFDDVQRKQTACLWCIVGLRDKQYPWCNKTMVVDSLLKRQVHQYVASFHFLLVC